MKKKFKFTARVISVILSVLLFADILPLQTFAATLPNQGTSARAECH